MKAESCSLNVRRPSFQEAEEAIRILLRWIGEDPEREGLKDTPSRLLRAWKNDLFSGYGKQVEEIFVTFEDGACDEMVVLRGVEFWSCCEHHLLPFYGVAHIAYLPNGRVIGASKLVRLLDIFARRLQIQERLTQQVTAALDQYLRPRGAACVIEATHLCMVCRGVKRQKGVLVTSSLTGEFLSDGTVRNEFLQLVGYGGGLR